MKKIISLLSVFAIICTMFTTVALAGSDELYWEEAVDGTNVTLTLKLNSSKPVTTAKLYFDMTAAKAACDGIAATKIDGMSFAYNASKSVLAATYANGDGGTSITLGKITFTNVKSTFTIPKATISNTTWVITDTSKVDFIPDITNNAIGYEVKVAGPTPVENPYVFSFDADEETEVKITNSRTGDRTYSLPSFVKGGAKVNALLKIKDDSDVKTGDKFTIDAIKGGKATTITTIEVE